jgi:hypothetical protein
MPDILWFSLNLLKLLNIIQFFIKILFRKHGIILDQSIVNQNGTEVNFLNDSIWTKLKLKSLNILFDFKFFHP